MTQIFGIEPATTDDPRIVQVPADGKLIHDARDPWHKGKVPPIQTSIPSPENGATAALALPSDPRLIASPRTAPAALPAPAKPIRVPMVNITPPSTAKPPIWHISAAVTGDKAGLQFTFPTLSIYDGELLAAAIAERERLLDVWRQRVADAAGQAAAGETAEAADRLTKSIAEIITKTQELRGIHTAATLKADDFARGGDMVKAFKERKRASEAFETADSSEAWAQKLTKERDELLAMGNQAQLATVQTIAEAIYSETIARRAEIAEEVKAVLRKHAGELLGLEAILAENANHHRRKYSTLLGEIHGRQAMRQQSTNVIHEQEPKP